MPINTIISKFRSNPNGITLEKEEDRREMAVWPMKKEVFDGFTMVWPNWFLLVLIGFE